MTDTQYQPLGPYQRYEQTGLPATPEKVMIDRRTGRPYGAVPEEDVRKDIIDTYSIATMLGKPEHEIQPVLGVWKDRIDADAPANHLRTGIVDATKGWFEIADLQAKAAKAANKYGETKDKSYLVEANSLMGKSQKMQREFPSVPRHSTLDTIIRDTVTGAASMYNMGAKMLLGAGAGAIVGGAIAGPWGAKTIGSLALRGNAIEGMYNLESGSAYLEMLTYEDPETGARIDPEIAWEYAQKYGAGAAALEYVQFAKILNSYKVLKTTKAGRRLYNFVVQAVENGVTGAATEGSQQALQIYAQEQAKKATVKKYREIPRDPIVLGEDPRKGTPPSFTPVNWDDVWAQIGEAQRMGGNAEAVMGAGAAVVGAGKSITTDAIREVLRRSEEEAYQATKVETEVKDRIDLEETKLNKTKTTVPVKSDESPVPTQAAEFTERELGDALNTEGIKGTTVTDEQIDGLILGAESEDAAIEGILNETSAPAQSEFAGGFLTELYSQHSLEQAEALEALLTARSGALGESLTSYLDRWRLSLEQGTTEEGVKAQLAFTEEGDTILTAFQKADVSSIAHELGHLFFQDVAGQDKTTLDNWLGAKDGVWTTEHEEQLARSWEKYLADGKAPTPELTGVFQKFTKWLTEIYGAIKDSVISVQFSDEVRGVFDNMLTSKKKAESLQRDDPAKLEKILYQKDEKVEALTEKDVQEMSETDLLKKQVKNLIKQARDAAAVSDKKTYDKKIAAIKATFQRRMEKSKLKARHKAVRGQMKKKIGGYKPKKINGVLRSRLSPDAWKKLQEILTLLSETKSMKQAHEKYQEILATEGWAEVDSLKARLLHAMSYVEQDSVDTLESLNKDITELIRGGRADSFLGRMLAWKSQTKKQVLAEILGPGVPLPETKVQAEKLFERTGMGGRFKRQLRDLTIGHDYIFGLTGMLEMISQNSERGIHDTETVKMFDTYQAEEQKRTEIRKDSENLLKWYGEIYGTKNSDSSLRAIWDDAVPTIDFDGMKWSPMELSYLWLQLKDPTLTKRLMNQGWEPGKLSEVDALLTNKQKAFATKISAWINNGDTFQQTADVYEAVYGAQLTRLPNYISVTAQDAELAETEIYSLLNMDKGAPQFTQDYALRASAETTGRIKERTASEKVKINTKLNLVAVAHAYSEETAHFRNLAIPIRKLNAVFTDADIKRAVISRYGPDVYRSLMKNIENAAQSGANTRETIKWLDRVRTAFILSKIAMSIPTFIKQHISMVQFMAKMPPAKFARYFMEFAQDPVKRYRGVAEKDWVVNRGTMIDRDFADMMKAPERRSFLKDPTFLNAITWLLRTGDRNGVILGGWPYREYLIRDKGMTVEEADLALAKEANKTQQSSMISQQSLLQRGGSAAKIFTMWSSGPIQALRQEIEAKRAHNKGRISSKQLWKTFFIYHVLVPQLFALTTNAIKSGMGGGDWDWWDHGLALAFGPLGNTMVVGRQIQALVKYMIKGNPMYEMSPFQSVVQDIGRAGKKVAHGDFDKLSLDDGARLIEGVGILVGIGTPVVRGERMVRGAIELATGKPREGTVHIMGQKPPKRYTPLQKRQREQRKRAKELRKRLKNT